MKLILLDVLFIILLASTTFCQEGVKTYDCEYYSMSYSLLNNKLDGEFIEYYNDGTKSTQGKYLTNQRIGDWSFWDASGNLVLKRKYVNNYVFEQLYPQLQLDESLNLLDGCKYYPVKNEQDYFSYRHIRENSVLYSKKVISNMLATENLEWFPNGEFLQMLKDNKASDDFLVFEIFESYKSGLMQIDDFDNQKLIAFKFTEEYVFDRDVQMMEYRILFICPVFKNTLTGEVSDQNWFYFPKLIPYFAKMKIQMTNDNLEISNLSDVFFFQNFAKQIYGEYQLTSDHLGLIDIEPDFYKDAASNMDKYQEESFRILFEIIHVENKLIISNYSRM